jgi:hypothetical protein
MQPAVSADELTRELQWDTQVATVGLTPLAPTIPVGAALRVRYSRAVATTTCQTTDSYVTPTAGDSPRLELNRERKRPKRTRHGGA